MFYFIIKLKYKILNILFKNLSILISIKNYWNMSCGSFTDIEYENLSKKDSFENEK